MFLVSKPSLVGLALVFGREHDGIPTEAEELLDEAGMSSSCRQSPAVDKKAPKKKTKTGWWFQIFFIVTLIWRRFPF